MLQHFQRFGYVQEVKLQADRGFAFVKMDTHENAANAIVHMQNFYINGNSAKVKHDINEILFLCLNLILLFSKK